jgi:DNA-3-methyladenine glycosylase II
MSRLTQDALNDGVARIAKRDRDMARALKRFGLPELRQRDPGFRALFRAIVGQQVSIAAAAAIWGRVEALCAPMTPESVLAQTEAALRAAGLSRQKVAYGRGLAGDIVEGRVRLDDVPAMADEDAIAELVKIKGIGRWSAEVYLLFALGRPDILPADDLALLAAAQHMKKLEARPRPKELTALAETWRPWRGAAAHMLWHYYHCAIMKAPPAGTPG